MFYLENADKTRFGSLKDNLMNQYISGNDPTTLVQAENLLTNYQDSLKKTLTNVVANIDSGHELSMVQSNKKKKDRKARKSAREDRRPPRRSSSQRSQSDSDEPRRTISGFQMSAERDAFSLTPDLCAISASAETAIVCLHVFIAQNRRSVLDGRPSPVPGIQDFI